MNKQNVIIYTSDNCSNSEKVINKMDKWGVIYTVKNVSSNREYLKELQNRGVYGTPATYVDEQPILGYQENKLMNVLNIGDSEQSYFRKF